MTKRSWGVIAAMLVLALLLSDVPVLAQGAPAQAPTAVFYRPMIRVPFRNVGNQGGFFNSGMGSSAYMIYPSYGGGGGTYGADRISAAASANREAATWAVRAGHGVWTMTSDARVVYTGVRIGMQDANITPMQYDVSADPDLSLLGKEYYYHRRPTAKMGYGAGEADGVAESGLGGNWFPGSDLIEEGNKSQPYSKAPVHIYNWNFSAYPTDDTWPEEIIVTKCTNSQGLTMTERAFAWSHPDFDDLFIDEYIIENTGDTDGDGVADAAMNQSNVFIGIQDRFNNGAAGQQAYYRYWRDERDWCMDDWYVYDQNLKLMYMWDGDHPLYQDYDDTGNPYRDVYSFGTLVNGGKIDQGENALMSPAHLGVAVLAYTDDVSRFRRGKSFCAYFGLTPRLDESGKVRRLGHISKQGPSVGRWLLVESAWRAVAKSEALRTFYERVQHGQVKRKKIAIVAVARKIVSIMRAMLTTGEVFNEALVLRSDDRWCEGAAAEGVGRSRSARRGRKRR